MTYTVVLLKEKDGRYSVVVPALSGCATFGESLPEALHMAEEAILAYLEGLQALGEAIPPDVDSVNVSLDEAVEASIYKLMVEEAEVVA